MRLTPAVIRAFVRDPFAPVTDPATLEKLIVGVNRSVDQVFRPWFRSQASGSKSLHAMLKAQRAIVIADGYQGFLDSAHVAHPGHEARTAPTSFGLPAGVPSREAEKRHQLGFARSITAEFSRTEVAGVSREWSPLRRRQLDGKRFVVQAINPRGFDQALQTMSNRIDLLRKLVPKAKDSAALRDEALDALADYYHTGVNLHLFPRVNNSVLMAQVNEVLEQMDLGPLAHGKLDEVAFLTGFQDFRHRFGAAALSGDPVRAEAEPRVALHLHRRDEFGAPGRGL